MIPTLGRLSPEGCERVERWLSTHSIKTNINLKGGWGTVNSRPSLRGDREVIVPSVLFSGISHPYAEAPSTIELLELPQMQEIPTDPFTQSFHEGASF